MGSSCRSEHGVQGESGGTSCLGEDLVHVAGLARGSQALWEKSFHERYKRRHFCLLMNNDDGEFTGERVNMPLPLFLPRKKKGSINKKGSKVDIADLVLLSGYCN